LEGLDVGQRAFRWREHLNAGDHILVAECDGGVVGFISGGPIREPLDGCDAELYAIYLLLKFQRMGIGTRLLIELAKHLDEAGFRSIAVWLFEANAAAHFYERSGAVRIAAKERKVGGRSLPLVAYRWPDLKRILACHPGQ
jgi:GNAT superfamily N-acetyltransferase